MKKIITDFTDIIAGWMNINIYDYTTESIRKTRVSYLQNFFDDLVMLGRFVLSPITGKYVLELEQEGYESSIIIHKYNNASKHKINVELEIDRFEDEPHTIFEDDNYSCHYLSYNDVDIKEFIGNIIELIEKHKKEYNEGFILCPADKLNEESFNILKQEYNKL